jgi:DNA-binding response OmpR family regulator
MEDFKQTNKDLFSLLIVDDDRANLKILYHMFKADFTIFTAADGLTALQIAENSQPNLIMLDVVMPGMSGFEVIERLKKSDKTRGIPVIFITGAKDRTNEKLGLEFGAVDYIHKPFDELIVKARVYNHMQTQIYKRSFERELRQRSEAEAASQNKSAFLEKIGNELKAPSNSITSAAELALDDAIPAATEGYLKKILEDSRLLTKIIDDILDMSKFESGRSELEKAPFNLRELVHESVAMITPKAKEKGVTLNFYEDPLIGKSMLGDYGKIRQTLVNLLSYAVKRTETGSVKLHVGIRNMSKQAVTVFFELTDGMLPTDGANGGKPDFEATALSVAKSNIELMGGKLNVRSEAEAGNVYVYELKFYFD